MKDLTLGEIQTIQCYHSVADPEHVNRTDVLYKLFVYRSFSDPSIPSQLIPRPCL